MKFVIRTVYRITICTPNRRELFSRTEYDSFDATMTVRFYQGKGYIVKGFTQAVLTPVNLIKPHQLCH